MISAAEVDSWSKQIVADTLQRLKRISKKDWPSIYNCLNCWKWDDRLGTPPEEWSTLPNWVDRKFLWFNLYINDKRKKDKNKIISPVMHCIVSAVGEKAVNRDWQINWLGRTEREFEDWWDFERPFLMK